MIPPPHTQRQDPMNGQLQVQGQGPETLQNRLKKL